MGECAGDGSASPGALRSALVRVAACGGWRSPPRPALSSPSAHPPTSGRGPAAPGPPGRGARCRHLLWSCRGRGDARALAARGPLPVGWGAGDGRHRQDPPCCQSRAGGGATVRRGVLAQSAQRPAGGGVAGRGYRGLSAVQALPPEGFAARLALLLELLQTRRGLLVLDNLETILRAGCARGPLPGRVRGLWRGAAAIGREQPPGLSAADRARGAARAGAAGGGQGPVRTLRLGGLEPAAGRALLQERGLAGDEAAWEALVGHYGGNPLALSVVGETIDVVFGSDIAAFLAQGAHVFGGIRQLLDEQVGRLSPLEGSVLTWLAVEREPVAFAALMADLGPGVGRGEVVEAVEALARRSLLERGSPGTFTLHPVVLEYATTRLVVAIAAEILAGEPALLLSQALIKATAKDYVRRSQEQLIAQPLLDRLHAGIGSTHAIEQHLSTLLEAWRGLTPAEQSYGPGNVINLLRLLRGDLRGLDLSRLAIRQAFFAAVAAQDVSLAFAQLSQCVFAEAFDVASSLVLSADGRYVAAGGMGGTLHVWQVANRTVVLMASAHGGTVRALAITADGKLIATGGTDGIIRLWALGDAKARTTWQGHPSQVTGVALSADGQWLASCGNDGKVKLWNAETGQQHAVFEGHTGAVYAVALSADGQVMASGSEDGTVRLWDVRLEKQRAVLHGHDGGVWSVALSADGGIVVSGGSDAIVRLWSDDDRAAARATARPHAMGLSGGPLRGWPDRGKWKL